MRRPPWNPSTRMPVRKRSGADLLAAEGRAAPRRFASRGNAILVCAIVLLLMVVIYAGDAWVQVLSVLLTDGVIALLWVIAATMLGSVLLRIVRALDPATFALRTISAAALGLGLFSIAALLLGLMGALNLATALALPVASAILWLLIVIRHVSFASLNQRVEQWLREPAGWGWWWVAPMVIFGMALVAATLPPGLLWPDDPLPYDVLEYHLQGPREWYEAGRIEPLRHNVYTFFPFNVEMQFLLAMHVRGGPWAGMYLAHLLSLAYVVLSVAGIYALAGTVPAVAASFVPWLMMLGTVAFNESGLLLYGTLAVGWILRGFEISDLRFQMRAFGVAGAMAGLACGVKYTAVPILLIAAPLAVILVARLPWRALLLNCTIYGFIGMLFFLPWIARNTAWTGNPVFPEAMHLLGQGHFGDDQVQRWERAHEPREDQRSMSQRLKAFGREIVIDWRYGFALIPLGVIAAVATIRDRRTLFLLIMLVALSIFWLALTHLQSRFFVVAVPLAALLLGSVRWWQARLAIVIFAVMLSLPAWLRVNEILSDRLEAAGELAGFQELSSFLSPEVSQHVQAGSKLAFVGEAKAFLYTLPMTHLRYRTVFDVDVTNARDAIDAWLGPDAEAVRATHYVVIDRLELERFSKTYLKNMPPLPAMPPDQPIVIIPPGSQ